MNEKLESLCKTYGFNSADEVKEIIHRAFTHNPLIARPKVFILIKALNVAKTFLQSDNLREIVKWAKSN